jgi:CubicO group peptidase (beta-lactamase class C family)
VLDFVKKQTDSIFFKTGVPGIAVGLLQNDSTYFYSTGFSNTQKKERFTQKTVFEIGSISKTFTAYFVQKLLDDQQIADTAAIGNYLPDSLQSNRALCAIRFRQLLNHTSGLARIPDNLILNLAPYDQYSESGFFHYLKSAALSNIGKYNYSNSGMALAGILAARIAHKDFEDFINYDILIPFNMVEIHIKSPYPKSQGYLDKEPVAFWQMDALKPAGSLQFCTQEMLLYLKYMLRPKPGETKRVIDEILIPTMAINNNLSIAKAWHIISIDKKNIYWHNGGTYGFSCFCAFNRENQTAVVVCINQFNKNADADYLGVSIMKKLLE